VILTSPEGYHVNAQVIALGGPILLNNFSGQYDHGGFVPPGGAEISITASPLPQVPLDAFISSELQGSSISSTIFVTVSGSSCTKVVYADSYGPNMSYSEIAVYCTGSTSLHKLYLFYRSGDPGANRFLNAFQEVLNTIRFTL
jgi:hypothetical protein